MKKTVFYAVAVTCAVSGAMLLAQGNSERGELANGHEPPMLGIHWAKGAKAASPFGKNANMSYHGGKIMQTVNIQPIFWGTSWSTYSGDKETGIDTFYTGHSGSNYAATVQEYSGSNGQVGNSTNAFPHLV